MQPQSIPLWNLDPLFLTYHFTLARLFLGDHPRTRTVRYVIVVEDTIIFEYDCRLVEL